VCSATAQGTKIPTPANARGTTQSDIITGTAQPDSILALGGLDDVSASGGDDFVDGGGGGDTILGGVGGDGLRGRAGPDDIRGGPGTSNASEPPFHFECTFFEPDGGSVTLQGIQVLAGEDGNDLLVGGRDNDNLVGGGGTNDYSGNGGGDCINLGGAENERASGGDGADIILAVDGNGDDVFCGPGNDSVDADADDRVAASCEVVTRPTPLQAPGATPEAEVTITTAPEEFGS
jgi:serralysin